MNNERLLILFTKKKAGEITLAEQLELSEYLKNNPSDNLLASSLTELMDFPLSFDTSEVDLESFIKKVHKKIEEKNKPQLTLINKWKGFRKMIAAAAAILIIVVSIYLFPLTNHTKSSNINVVETTKGSRTFITLPDGSKVWLNADSRINYGKDFGKGIREISLIGEGYFDIVKDASHPFIIHTNSMDIKVLGTAFNVKAYPEDDYAQTTLIRGAIEVTLRKKDEKTISLRPNEKLLVANVKKLENQTQQNLENTQQLVVLTELHKTGDSSVLETEWMRNRLAFKSEELQNIALMLERWYGMKVRIKNEELKTRKFSGSFETETFYEVLDALKITGNFHYSINKNVIDIYP